jgi:hypothetical protein
VLHLGQINSGYVKAGTWVEVRQVLLRPGERSPDVPPETQAVPYVARIKGFLLHDATIGQEVRIRTVIGRTVVGELLSVNPPFEHGFGSPVPELLPIGQEVRSLLGGG